MSAHSVIGTYCIHFVYMGGFIFNEIITDIKKSIRSPSLTSKLKN